jgi:hypothetical protein
VDTAREWLAVVGPARSREGERGQVHQETSAEDLPFDGGRPGAVDSDVIEAIQDEILVLRWNATVERGGAELVEPVDAASGG